MIFDIKRHYGTYEGSISLLNSKAKDLFNGHNTFNRKDYLSYIKSSLLNSLLHIERVIKGTFNCDIFMKNADVELLKKMFPNGTKILGANDQDSVVKIGRFFDILRNLCAHTVDSDRDFFIFTFDFSNLREEKRFNDDIIYEIDGKLTVAGLIYIILNFLREESIATLVKKDDLYAFVSCGRRCKDNGNLFVSEISHADLTLPIRTSVGNSVISSIAGDYPYQNENEFSVAVGSPNAPVFKVNCKYENRILTIKEGSLTKTYYYQDYFLEVSEEKLFIELSNRLPSMVLVDLCFLLGITKFDVKAYNKIEEKFDLYEKLNHPKFYVDKNIGILLLPETNSDYRLVSSVVTGGLSGIISAFEYKIILNKHIKIRDDYSTFKDLLKCVGIPKNIITPAVVLRNFAMHGYIFDEYIILDNSYYKYTLDFCIKTLLDLLKSLKPISEILYESLAILIDKLFLSTLVVAKYKKAVETSLEFVNNPSNKQLSKDLTFKNNFINHSFYDITKLNELNELCGNQTRVFCYDFGDELARLYFYNSSEYLDAARDYLSAKKYEIHKEINL